MVYTKEQKRCRVSRIKFGAGRSASKREEDRRNDRQYAKEITKQLKGKPKTQSFLSRVKKMFGRNR